MSHPTIPPQIGRLLPLLASDKDGEVIATARAICRTLGAAGLDLHDVAAALPTNATALPRCDASLPTFFDLGRAVRDLDAGQLTFVERRFVLSMCALGSRQPSPRQAAWLRNLYIRLQQKGAA